MNRSVLLLIVSLFSAGLQITNAQGTAQAEKLLASAQRKASVDGDLKGAIEDYKKVIAAAGGNRALSAQALLRMAECHQKLGDIEAQTIYERVVRDYADQKDAATVARSRLGVTPSVARVKGDRSVWSGPEVDGFGTISPDGRVLTYTDWSTGGLVLRDLATGTDHRLTTGTYADGMTQYSAISKDGRHLAYQWLDTKVARDARRYELRVARLQATGMSDSRRLFDNPDVTSTAPFDWSPDGKWIAAQVSRKDRTNEIAIVSVEDGSMRVLKSIDWKQPTKVFFSPDSRYIAFDLMVTDSSDERHVFLMAIDGSRETAAVAHPSQNVIMGWSPDGKQLLFASNRSGSFGLWAVPVDDGRAHDTPTLVKPDIASTWSLGLTTAGAMYVWKYASPIYVQVSPIDLTAGTILPGPTTFQRFIGSRGRPDWSADGKFLAYQSCAPLGAGPCTLWVRLMESGQLREVPTQLRLMMFPRWSPDGRELIARGNDLRRRNNGLYRIDARTGDATLVVSPYPGHSLPQWAADGKSVYYRRETAIIDRDLATGTERHVVQIPTAGDTEFAVSPDGRTVAYHTPNPSGTQEVFVMPFSGGPGRSLLRLSAPERLARRFQWTSDGQALVVAKERGASGRKELWLVPVTAERPRKLDINIDHWMLEDGFQLDHTGKQIAFVGAAGKAGMEIRALENFLPEQAAARSSAKK